MSKNEFLDQLSQLLLDISPEERDEALAYYREYIEDAGFENEDAVLEELGTPKEVADEIKSGILNKNNPDIHTSSGNVKHSPKPYTSESGQQPSGKKTKGRNIAVILLAVIGVLLLSPLLLGIIGSVLGVVVGFFAAAVGILLALGVAGIVCFLVGIVLIIWGIGTLFSNPAVGLGLIGAGLIVTALGILLLLLTGVICCKALPWVICSISNLIHRFRRNKEANV